MQDLTEVLPLEYRSHIFTEPQVEAVPLVGSTPSTLDGLPISKFWHNLCETTHKKCHNSIESTFKPTRLVDFVYD